MARAGRTVLVTGATAGIGRAAALLLARRGHRVLATGRREDRLRTLDEEASGLRLQTLALDVTDATSRTAAVEAVRETTGEASGLDVLVNNAGYGLAGPVERLDLEDLRRQFETNLFGLVALTQAFLPAMRERGEGRIVNVSSVVGRLSIPLQGAYNATKFALEGLSDALRREVAPFGVRVVLVEPGAIRTEFGDVFDEALAKAAAAASPYRSALERYRTVVERTYAKAPGPEIVARAIVRAVEARRPRVRYVVPFSGRLALAAAALLPARWLDALLRRATGLAGS